MFLILKHFIKKMDVLNPNLQWLLTELLPDGPLAVLSNSSKTINRILYFNHENTREIQKILNLKLIDRYTLKKIFEVLLFKGPSSLIYFNLMYSGINDQNVKTIIKLLNSNIINLDLSQNEIGNIGAKYLADYIKFNNSIEILNLSENQIGEEGAKYFGEALKVNSSLQNLDLEKNQIGDEGAKALVKVLINSDSLELLDIRYNQLGKEGIEYMRDMKKNEGLMFSLEY